MISFLHYRLPWCLPFEQTFLLLAVAAAVTSAQLVTRVIPGRPQTVLTVSNVDVRPRNPVRQPLAPREPSSPVEEGEPRPYSFSYEAVDDQTGANSKREESSDGRTVRGSYSYIDPDGVFRVVEYTADENGFNANVRTNEPGTAAAPGDQPNPANTVWAVEPPPADVVARYATSQPRSDRPIGRQYA